MILKSKCPELTSWWRDRDYKYTTQKFPARSAIYAIYDLYYTSFSFKLILYRVTHKGWDCKGDLKLFQYDGFKIKYFAMNIVFSWPLKWLGKEINKFTVAGNTHFKEKESVNPVQPSLKSHPLWVTLYSVYLVETLLDETQNARQCMLHFIFCMCSDYQKTLEQKDDYLTHCMTLNSPMNIRYRKCAV